jgi:hypothetical protein
MTKKMLVGGYGERTAMTGAAILRPAVRTTQAIGPDLAHANAIESMHMQLRKSPNRGDRTEGL